MRYLLYINFENNCFRFCFSGGICFLECKTIRKRRIEISVPLSIPSLVRNQTKLKEIRIKCKKKKTKKNPHSLQNNTNIRIERERERERERTPCPTHCNLRRPLLIAEETFPSLFCFACKTLHKTTT
jgi:hypothetical protein